MDSAKLNEESSELEITARRALPLLDLTLLGESDTEEEVLELCDKALTSFGTVASVCIWPAFVPAAVQRLKPAGLPVCAVANFPEGDNDPDRAVADALRIVGDGGAEVDVVIPWRTLAAGTEDAVRYLVAAVRNAIGDQKTLKAILETGELSDPSLIRFAATEAIDGGADFLKTSTDKTEHSASPEAAQVLLEVIRDHPGAPRHPVGLKVSGGVRTVGDAQTYLRLADHVMGPDWVCPDTFRFGASGLLDAVLEAIGQSST